MPWLQDFVLKEAVLNLYCCCCWPRSDHDHLYVHDSYVLIAEAYSHACLLSLQMVSQSQGFLQVIAETNVQIISLQLILLHRWENNIKMVLKEVWINPYPANVENMVSS